MKKILLGLLAALLLTVGPAIAANVTVTEIMDTDFNAVTTADVSTAVNIQGFEKVAFFVTYDETEVGETLSADVTIDISYDNSTYMDASFYDYAGGSTLQTTQNIAADGSYYFWFNKDLCVPYVHVDVAATDTDADDLISVQVNIVTQE